MRKREGVAAAMVVAVVATGCLEHTYQVGGGAPAAPVVYEEWHHHWLGGLIGERSIEIEQYCPSGRATIHDEQSFLNGLVSALTSGIYMPTTVKIRCDDGMSSAVEVELDEGEVMTILEAPVFLHRVEELIPGRLETARNGVRALQQDTQD